MLPSLRQLSEMCCSFALKPSSKSPTNDQSRRTYISEHVLWGQWGNLMFSTQPSFLRVKDFLPLFFTKVTIHCYANNTFHMGHYGMATGCLSIDTQFIGKVACRCCTCCYRDHDCYPLAPCQTLQPMQGFNDLCACLLTSCVYGPLPRSKRLDCNASNSA